MIKHIHRHLHKKTHLPTLGVFATVASIALVAAVAIYEFSPQTGSPRTALAALRTTPACEPRGTILQSPSTTMVYPGTVVSGNVSFLGNFTVPSATPSGAFSDGSCVAFEISMVVNNTSTMKTYYTTLDEIGTQTLSAGSTWSLAIPFDTRILTNTSTSQTSDGYRVRVTVFPLTTSSGAYPYRSEWSSGLFDVQNTSTVSSSVQPYTLLSPTAAFSTTSPFYVTVRRPTDTSTMPVMVRARIDGAGILLPWKKVGETATWTAVSGTSTDFRTQVTSIPSYETYAFRACPNSVANDTYTLPERCSNEVRVTFVNTTTTTNTTPVTVPNTNTTTNTNIITTNTTTSPSRPNPPIILTPTVDAQLNELYRVSGRSDRGTTVKIDILRYETNSAQPVLVLGREVSTTDLESYATYSVPINALRPGSYRVTAQAKKSGVVSDPRSQNFAILPISLVLKLPDWSTSDTSISGIVTITAQSNRSDLGKVSIYRRAQTDTSAPPVLIGDAQRVSGSSTTWTLSFDTTSQPDGTWKLYGVAEVAGISVASGALTVTLAGSESIPEDEVETPSDEPATDDEPVTDPAEPIDEDIDDEFIDEPTEEEIIEEETNTNTPAVSNTNTPVATNVNEATSIVTNTPTVLRPEVDPRRTGNTVPERMAVEAITTLATQTNTPTGLQLTGFGPPNSIVTIYIFSNPIVLTTKTDANGNWAITLDRQLDNGSHEVYVTLTDDAGQVQEKSNPLGFFVAEARAVSEADYRQFQATQARTSDNYLRYYLALSALIVAFTVTLILYLRLSRRHQQLKAGV